MIRNQYYGVDSISLQQWKELRTHATMDALPAPGKHPLLLFSVGLGVIRANYTSFAVELASHGYVVALVESPLQGLMVLPDGREIQDTAGKYQQTLEHRRGVSAWAHDLSFAIDTLEHSHGSATSLATVGATIDTARIGALGHSSGGLVAIQACETDRRIRTCVDLDGGLVDPSGQPIADFVVDGVSRPTLFLRSQPLYDDSTLARRHMTREQWEERGAASKQAFNALVARSSGPIWTALVAGSGHMTFSDAPFVMPSAITRFGGRIIAADRGWRVITATIRAWFDKELLGRGDGVAGVAAHTPELTVTPPHS
jgi:hypothetical protein